MDPLPWRQAPIAYSSTDTGHGRTTTRPAVLRHDRRRCSAVAQLGITSHDTTLATPQ